MSEAAKNKKGSFKNGNELKFRIITTKRSYKMQVANLAELLMWSRAFSLLFEIRILVGNSLFSEVIHQNLGIEYYRCCNIDFDPRLSISEEKGEQEEEKKI